MARVIAADRPGYGYSGFGKLYLSYYTQAALLAPIIKKYGANRKLILVGSSYGGLCAPCWLLSFLNTFQAYF